MKILTIVVKVVDFCAISLVLMVASALTVRAQAQTFVSAEGLDTNPCSQTMPCKTVNHALSLTSTGGEVLLLDSGAYAPFTITKAVTVEAPAGVLATIATSSGDDIDITAGTSDKVVLRGLKVFGQVSAAHGIQYNSGGALHVESCIVSGFGIGIHIVGPGSIFVKDTTLYGNSAAAFYLDFSALPSASATFAIENVHAYGNAEAIDLTLNEAQTVKGVIRNSQIDGDSEGGLTTQASANSVLSVDVEGCSLSQDVDGIYIINLYQSQTYVSLSNCFITGNQQFGYDIVNPVSMAEAIIYSRGNNVFVNNGPNQGVLTPLAGQ